MEIDIWDVCWVCEEGVGRGSVRYVAERAKEWDRRRGKNGNYEDKKCEDRF